MAHPVCPATSKENYKNSGRRQYESEQIDCKERVQLQNGDVELRSSGACTPATHVLLLHPRPTPTLAMAMGKWNIRLGKNSGRKRTWRDGAEREMEAKTGGGGSPAWT